MSIRILIIDDDPIIQKLLSNWLEEYIIFTANSGLDGIDMIDIVNPDIIIIDALMPKLDGFATAKIIKKNHSDIQIILITSLNEILNNDLDDLISKPIKKQFLKIKVKNLIEKKLKIDFLKIYSKYFHENINIDQKNRLILIRYDNDKYDDTFTEVFNDIEIRNNFIFNEREILILDHQDIYYIINPYQVIDINNISEIAIKDYILKPPQKKQILFAINNQLEKIKYQEKINIIKNYYLSSNDFVHNKYYLESIIKECIKISSYKKISLIKIELKNADENNFDESSFSNLVNLLLKFLNEVDLFMKLNSNIIYILCIEHDDIAELLLTIENDNILSKQCSLNVVELSSDKSYEEIMNKV